MMGADGRGGHAPLLFLLIGAAFAGMTAGAFLDPPEARAATLSGSLRTAVYSEESRAGEGKFESLAGPDGRLLSEAELAPLENRTRIFETVRLDALGLGLRGLSAHTAATASNVVTHQSLDDTVFRLYRAFLQYEAPRGSALGYQIRAGRHWVVAGVGSRTIDGASARIGARSIGEVVGYFGTLGIDRLSSTDRVWSLDDPDDSRAYGGRVRVQPELGPVRPRVAVSYAKAERTPHEVRVTDEERLGVHGELRFAGEPAGGLRVLRGLRAFADWRQDLVYGRALSTMGGLEWRGGRREALARVEYQDRRPQLRATSFFAPFVSEPVKELRATAGAGIGRGLRLDAEGSLFRFDGDEEDTGLALLLSGYDITLGYRVRDGWGGALNGIVLRGYRDLGDRLSVEASLDYTDYEYGNVDEEDVREEIDNRATTGILALGYLPHPKLRLTAQVEGLSTARHESELRFLGMVDWRFRTAF